MGLSTINRKFKFWYRLGGAGASGGRVGRTASIFHCAPALGRGGKRRCPAGHRSTRVCASSAHRCGSGPRGVPRGRPARTQGPRSPAIAENKYRPIPSFNGFARGLRREIPICAACLHSPIQPEECMPGAMNHDRRSFVGPRQDAPRRQTARPRDELRPYGQPRGSWPGRQQNCGDRGSLLRACIPPAGLANADKLHGCDHTRSPRANPLNEGIGRYLGIADGRRPRALRACRPATRNSART